MEDHQANKEIIHPHNRQYKPRYEVADIFRLYLSEYLKKHKLSLNQYKAVNAIMSCRTSMQGYHKYKCEECGYEDIEYNSCRNRHCPKCQGAKRDKWVADRLNELLPVYYYHAVFTLVHTLNIIALYNKEIFYDLFMKASAKTLQEFAEDPKYLGAKIGFVGILHTWGQSLSQHLHAHYIIPGGGITKDGRKWKNLPYRKDFLFPVKAMSKRMRNTFSKMLLDAYDKGKLIFPEEYSELREPDKFKEYLDKAAWENWVCYVKKPFSGPEDVVKYIGRYTHRVAISNSRIIDISNGEVRFKYKDYRDESKTKIMKLSAEEFIRRFMLHILPKGFQKIRYFGIFANGKKNKYLALARKLLNVTEEKIKKAVEYINDTINKLLTCPCCGRKLSIVEVRRPYKYAPG